MSGLLWTIRNPKQAYEARYGYKAGDQASPAQLSNRATDRAQGMALARNAQADAESLARTQARVGQIIAQANQRFEGGGRALGVSGLDFTRYARPAPQAGSLGPDALGRRWR